MDQLCENVFPIAYREGRTLLVASSPIDAESDRSRMFRATDKNGKHIFRILNFSTICEKCMDNRTIAENPREELFCEHKLDALPQWVSRETQEVMRSILPEYYYITEILGAQPSLAQLLFNKLTLHRLFDAAHGIKPSSQSVLGDMLWIGLDPGSGGDQHGSEYGFSCHYFDGDTGALMVRMCCMCT